MYDGHKGTLDIYHLPGIGIWPAPSITDRRIGVFYDAAGTAFRVNGSLSGNKIEFWFDSAKPNLPWNELSGQRFVYHLEPTLDIMTGLHYDGDGRSYGGYGTKRSYIVHGKPSLNAFSALANTKWNVLIGDMQGLVQFGPSSGSSVDGVMSLFSGGTRNVEANLLEQGQVTFWLEGSVELATARFLNHAPGLLCGSTNDNRAFYAAYVASR